MMEKVLIYYHVNVALWGQARQTQRQEEVTTKGTRAEVRKLSDLSSTLVAISTTFDVVILFSSIMDYAWNSSKRAVIIHNSGTDSCRPVAFVSVQPEQLYEILI